MKMVSPYIDPIKNYLQITAKRNVEDKILWLKEGLDVATVVWPISNRHSESRGVKCGDVTPGQGRWDRRPLDKIIDTKPRKYNLFVTHVKEPDPVDVCEQRNSIL